MMREIALKSDTNHWNGDHPIVGGSRTGIGGGRPALALPPDDRAVPDRPSPAIGDLIPLASSALLLADPIPPTFSLAHTISITCPGS
jgi:hypothetical protein